MYIDVYVRKSVTALRDATRQGELTSEQEYRERNGPTLKAT